MRYATDSQGNFERGDGNKSALSTLGNAATVHEVSVRHGSSADSWSLRQLLPTARSFDGSDIRFADVIEELDSGSSQIGSGADNWSDKLIVYRIGTVDPMRLVSEALARGAAGILTEQVLPCPLPQFIVSDVELAAAKIDAVRMGRPDRQLLTVGVMGAAGKTTTSLLVASVLRGAGIRTAYHSDLGDCDGLVQNTPDRPLQSGRGLINQIAEAVDSRCQAMVIELDEADLRRGHHDAIEFDVLIASSATSQATDFGPDQLECALDRLTSDGVIICNADDANVIRVVRDAGVRMVTHSMRSNADVTGKMIDQSGGMSTLLVTYDDTTIAMETSLCGAAMASNHLAAACFGVLIDQPVTSVLDKLSMVRDLPGRLQQINSRGRANVILDVASTGSQVAAALRAAKSMRDGGRLWCVLAIDETQTPDTVCQFGHLLERFADRAIITTRTDQKVSFLKRSHSVLDGVQKCAAFRLVADQDRAIEWTMGEAARGDIVLIFHPVSGLTAQRQRGELEAIAEKTQVACRRGSTVDRPTLRVVGAED